MSTASKILSNTVSQVIGKIFIAILALGSLKIATNYLSLQGYGEYVVIYEFLAFFGISADLGLFTIAVREMAKDEKQIPKIIGNVLSLRTFLVILTMIASVIIAYLVPKYQGTRIPIGVAIATITVFFTIINGTLSSVLQVKLKMHIASFATVLGKALSVGAMFYVVMFGFPNDKEMGFYMLIMAGTLGTFLMLLTTNYYVRKITPLVYRFDFNFWKDVLMKSAPYGAALILNTVYLRVGSLLLSVMVGQKEVGIYGVATRMLENFSILPLYFMNSVLPVLTREIAKKNEKYKNIISYSFDFLASMSIPLVAGGVVLAYPIVFIVSNPTFLSRLSEGFYGSDIAFQILIFALLFQFLNVLFAFILIAVNKQAKLLYINFFCVLLNVIGNVIFIPRYGIRSAAMMSVISELFILVLTYAYAKKHLKFSINFLNLFKIIISALIMGAAIYLLQPITYKYVQNWNVILLVPFGMIIYAGMLFATKVVNKNTLTLLRRGESRSEPEQIGPIN
ncbi:flippase [Candidatus Peregrinibacteria bacterium]|nr:flippase [Candidatus Peregrinibacteria bacterium]